MENDPFLLVAQNSLLRIHPHRRHRRSIPPRPDPVPPDRDPRLRVELHILHNPLSRLCLHQGPHGRQHRIQDTFRSALHLPPAKISKYWRVTRLSLFKISGSQSNLSLVNFAITFLLLKQKSKSFNRKSRV
jgi:hypothetical protein